MDKHSDCIGCLMRPFVTLGSVCGANVMSVTCPHTKRATNTVKFARSQSAIIISSLFALILLTGIVYNFCYLVTSDYDTTKILLTLTEILFCTGAFACSALGIVKHRELLTDLNGLATLAKNRQHYGFWTFVTTRMAKSYITKVYLSIAVLIIVEIVYLTSSVENYTSAENQCLFDIIMAIFTNYAQSVSVLQSMLATYLYGMFFKTCFYRVKQILTRKDGKKHRSVVKIAILASPENLPLRVKLKRLNNFYSALVYNYRQLNIFINPTFLLWWIILTAILIINIYILLLIYSDNGSANMLLTIRVYGSIFGIIAYLWVTEAINGVSQDILSFLFKYPISKLSTAEAAQVEMLITTLNIHKPVLRASDIFTVGTRLLASISGTVVTYVLVALQFHASWAKPK